MKTHSERFERAMAALVKAYLNETLQAGNCHACAVGNIIAFSNKLEVNKQGVRKGIFVNEMPGWSSLFNAVRRNGFVNKRKYAGKLRKAIESTGYSCEELMRVERAFENATRIKLDCKERYGVWHSVDQIDADQLAGLHAVVNVLCEIEGITDPAPYNALFDKTQPLQLV